MANFGNWDVQFDPVGFAGEIAKRMGQTPSDSSFMSNPFGHMAMALGQQPSSAAQIQPPAMSIPSAPSGVSVKTKEPEAEANNSIVPPEAVELAKKAKIKGPMIDQIIAVVGKGILPGTKQFSDALGISMEQHGMRPTAAFGPFGRIRDAWSADAQNVIRMQEAADTIGASVLKFHMDRLGAPKDIGSATAALGEGVIPLTDIQKEDKVEGLRRGADVNFVGPMEGVQNYHTPLEPWQQDMAKDKLHGLSTGTLMRETPKTPGERGEIVPTSFMNAQGRLLSPEQIAYADKAAQTDPSQPIPPAPSAIPASAVNNIIDTRNKTTAQRIQSNVSPEVADWANRAIQTPPDQPLPPVPEGVILPPTVMNKVMEERGQLNRAANKGPEYEKRVESLAAVESRKKHGKTMSFFELTQKDPDLAQNVRQRADIEEPKDIYSYQQTEQAKRQIAVAAPVKTAQMEAERDQPINEPQLWRDPYSGKAADPQMTTRQAQEGKFVKLRPDQVETVNQLDVIDQGLQKIKDISKKVMSARRNDPLAEAARAISQTAYLYYLRKVGDENMVKLDSTVARLTAPLVKSQGDTANIAVAEREMFAKALVNNQASSEAVLANLDDVLETTRSARQMMGFKSTEELVKALLQSGASKDEVKKALEKRGLLKDGKLKK